MHQNRAVVVTQKKVKQVISFKEQSLAWICVAFDQV